MITTGTGQTYVGQSGNMNIRLATHVATGKFSIADAMAAQRFEVLGGKTAREVSEQGKIDRLGGVKAVNANSLNIVNPIGASRAGQLMPPGYSRPGLKLGPRG